MNKNVKGYRATLTASELLGVKPTTHVRFDLTATECAQAPRILQGTLLFVCPDWVLQFGT